MKTGHILSKVKEIIKEILHIVQNLDVKHSLKLLFIMFFKTYILKKKNFLIRVISYHSRTAPSIDVNGAAVSRSPHFRITLSGF